MTIRECRKPSVTRSWGLVTASGPTDPPRPHRWEDWAQRRSSTPGRFPMSLASTIREVVPSPRRGRTRAGNRRRRFGPSLRLNWLEAGGQLEDRVMLSAANLDQCQNGGVGPPITLEPCAGTNGAAVTVSGTAFKNWVNGNVN